jgi:nicotinamide riboside kinase
MKVINLFGGPGVGKTTLAMRVFTELNMKQIKVEYVDEYAKELTWNQSFKLMENQRMIFANQHQKFFRLKDTIDICVTDAPLFNSIVYSGKNDKNKTFHADVFHEFMEYKNLNFFVQRETEYKEHGRSQKLEDAMKVDEEVLRCLQWFKVPYAKIGLENATETILSYL